MRQIDHFISGGAGASASRFGEIMDPNNGGVQARVVLGDANILERAVQAALAAHHLTVLGGFHPTEEDGTPPGTETLLLLGPAEPGFWAHMTAQPEWLDDAPDPVDRWSRRVIGTIACDLGAKALFPFGGPPYHPFYQWALRTGRVGSAPSVAATSAIAASGSKSPTSPISMPLDARTGVNQALASSKVRAMVSSFVGKAKR